MKDSVVINNLYKRNFDFNDTEKMLMLESIEHKPRYLDKAPKRIVLQRAKEKVEFGCRADFIILFNSVMSEISGDVFTLDLNSVKRYCDKKVYAILQALIRDSISKNKCIADGCYDLFRTIATAQVDTLTEERVYDVLRTLQPTDYWTKQLLAAVNVCLVGDSEAVVYWGFVAQFTGIYKECFEAGKDVIRATCATEKDVDAFVRKWYKDAKANEEFMGKVYTEGVSKGLIAMLYYLDQNGSRDLVEQEAKA